jgi:WD40 repeat protein
MSAADKEKLQEQIYQENITALKWLIQQGYDLNVCAYDEGTTLYYSIDYSPGIRLMKFLLENGADPNIDCYINNDGGDVTCALVNVWDNYNIWDKSDFPLLDEMEKLLKKYGAE